MKPSSTPAANRISTTIRMPITMSSAGTIFSNSIEFLGVRDFPVVRVSLPMLTFIDPEMNAVIFSACSPHGSMEVYVDSD